MLCIGLLAYFGVAVRHRRKYSVNCPLLTEGNMQTLESNTPGWTWPLPSCVISGKLIHLSEPLLENSNIIELTWRLCEIVTLRQHVVSAQ